MKRKLFRLLIAGFGLVLSLWGTLPVQGESNQMPTPQYRSSAQRPELTALLDGGGSVAICFPGDQKCRHRSDSPTFQPIYFPGRSYAAKLFDGPTPVPICYPGDQKCK